MPVIAALPTQSSATWSALALAGWLLLCFSAAAMVSFFMPGERPNWVFGP